MEDQATTTCGRMRRGVCCKLKSQNAPFLARQTSETRMFRPHLRDMQFRPVPMSGRECRRLTRRADRQARRADRWPSRAPWGTADLAGMHSRRGTGSLMEASERDERAGRLASLPAGRTWLENVESRSRDGDREGRGMKKGGRLGDRKRRRAARPPLSEERSISGLALFRCASSRCRSAFKPGVLSQCLGARSPRRRCEQAGDRRLRVATRDGGRCTRARCNQVDGKGV